MKYKLIIDNEKEESIVITAHERNDLIVEIEKLIKNNELNLIGYQEDKMIPLVVNDIYSFYTKNGKIYATTKNENYFIKQRLYQLLEELNETFIKINQGCLINIKKIQRFESSIGGSIKVVLKNGFSDYVSRRELKNVKRRLGL